MRFIFFKKFRFVDCLGIAFFVVLFSSQPATAAQLILTGSAPALPAGQTLQVNLDLKTEGETINAIGATLKFPANLLEFKSVRDGGSLVSLWVEPAHLAGGSAITFSGITPGGFGASTGRVLSFLFQTKAEGTATVTLSDIQLLRNDGKGTPIPVADAVLLFTVAADAPSLGTSIAPDTTPPELFTISLSRNPVLFNGQWFIVFTAQDKESGIDHYEIAERRGPLINVSQNDQRLVWRQATSPYIILDQSLVSAIYVRAIDRAGNDRVASVAPQTPLVWYENYKMWGILFGIVVVVIVIIGLKLWKVKRRH